MTISKTQQKTEDAKNTHMKENGSTTFSVSAAKGNKTGTNGACLCLEGFKLFHYEEILTRLLKRKPRSWVLREASCRIPGF